MIDKDEQRRRIIPLIRVGLQHFSAEFIRAFTQVAPKIEYKILDTDKGVTEFRFVTFDADGFVQSFNACAVVLKNYWNPTTTQSWANKGVHYNPSDLTDPDHPHPAPSLLPAPTPAGGTYLAQTQQTKTKTKSSRQIRSEKVERKRKGKNSSAMQHTRRP